MNCPLHSTVNSIRETIRETDAAMVVLANVVATLSNLETQSRVASGKAVKAADAAAEEYSENADEKASLARTAVSVLDSVVFCHRAVTAAMLDVNTDLAALVTGAEECSLLAGSSDTEPYVAFAWRK